MMSFCNADCMLTATESMLLIVPEAKKGLPKGCFLPLNCIFLSF